MLAGFPVCLVSHSLRRKDAHDLEYSVFIEAKVYVTLATKDETSREYFEITRRSHSNAHILVFGLLISRKWSLCSRSLNLE